MGSRSWHAIGNFTFVILHLLHFNDGVMNWGWFSYADITVAFS